jgi:hypothetical protein
VVDAISAGLQSAVVFLGFGKALFKDEARHFGLDGRKLARICLISSVGLPAANQTREAIRTKDPIQVNCAASLWTITSRFACVRKARY